MPKRAINLDTAQRIERARFWAEKLADAATDRGDLNGAVDDVTLTKLRIATKQILGAIAAVNAEVDPTPKPDDGEERS
jgi:hypothetical protein